MDHVLKTGIVCKELTKFLIETIHIAFEKNRRTCAELDETRRKLTTLMPRECYVLDHIVVEKTIKVYRAHLIMGMLF